MSLPRKKPYGCFVTTPCAYLWGGRVCRCLYTHSQPKCQENDNQQGRGAIRGCLLPRSLTASSEAAGKHGDNQSSDGGVSSLGAFLALLVGLPALPGGCCCRTAVKGCLQPHKEPPACAPTAVLSTQSVGVPLAQGPISF